jgi:D-glycero-D-manno-heptose 1,7-bisphosphate phosphatase
VQTSWAGPPHGEMPLPHVSAGAEWGYRVTMNPLVAEPSVVSARQRVGAVLFASDDTLLFPPDAGSGEVEPAFRIDYHLARARLAGLSIGLVAGARQSRLHDDRPALMKRLDDLFGPFDVVATCFHASGDGGTCDCVGLDPGTVRAAAAALRLPPSRCLVVGASASDADAARGAGAIGVVMAFAEAVEWAIESLRAPDQALDHSLEALEQAWKIS